MKKFFTLGLKKEKSFFPKCKNGRKQKMKGNMWCRGLSEKKESSGFKGFGWAMLGVMAVGGTAALIWLQQKRKELGLNSNIRTYGKAQIGAPFTLMDDEGRFVNDRQLRADGEKYLLIYFGFSFCPDICPLELERMSRIVNILDGRALSRDKLVPLMISVDPKRDDVLQLKNYVRQFHPKLVGLTGTPKMVEAVSRTFRVYSSTGLTDDELDEMDDYLLDHSIFFYFLGKDGQFKEVFARDRDSDEIAESIYRVIEDESSFSFLKLYHQFKKLWFGIE